MKYTRQEIDAILKFAERNGIDCYFELDKEFKVKFEAFIREDYYNEAPKDVVEKLLKDSKSFTLISSRVKEIIEDNVRLSYGDQELDIPIDWIIDMGKMTYRRN